MNHIRYNFFVSSSLLDYILYCFVYVYLCHYKLDECGRGVGMMVRAFDSGLSNLGWSDFRIPVQQLSIL